MRHGWRPLQKYLEVHERVLRFQHKHMTLPKVYEKVWVTPYYLELVCKNISLCTFKGNLIRVDLRITTEVDRSVISRPQAKTYSYSFNANQPKGGPLIRYCSPHLDPHPERGAEHHRDHHKHDFSSGIERILILSAEERPHVGEFFNEVLSSF